MKNVNAGISAVCGVFVAVGALAPLAHASSYEPGDQWVRVNQSGVTSLYVAGKNYLNGNPWVDNQNNFVWSYEYVVSNGADGLVDGPMPPEPWYRHDQPSLLVWDDAFRGGHGEWAVADDTPCTVNAEFLTHDWGAASGDAWKFVPVVRWRNPVDEGGRFSVSGRLVVEWEGGDGANDELVDVVVLHDKRRGPNDPVAPLVSTTLSRADGATQEILIDLADFRPANSESLLLSMKARVSGPASAQVARVMLRDELVITLDRAPRGYCPEDLNRDGQINFGDLNRMLGLFGLTCAEVD
ncbi:MAG: hypothetical protein ACTS27_01255 [Phycisphaerales bacterium]